MKIEEIKKNQILTDDNNMEYLVLKNDENSLELFILNGFYTYIFNKLDNTYFFKYKSEEEEIHKTEFNLMSYNLCYEYKLVNKKVDLDNLTLLSETFDIEFRKKFFDNLNRISGNKIESSYKKLEILNEVSKSFDDYFNYKNIPIVYKVGDVFTDNLMRTDFFSVEENDFGLNNNYWVIAEVDKINNKAFAVHLEYFTVAEFDWIGKIEKLVNDVDSRFGKCLSMIPKASIYSVSENYGKNDTVYVSDIYSHEKITDKHFFNNIKLVKKIEFNEKQKDAIWFNLVFRVNYYSFKSVQTKNFYFRGYLSDLMEKFLEKRPYLGYFDLWDKSKTIPSLEYKHTIYDRFVYDDFEDKTKVLISSLLKLNRPKDKKFENVLNKKLVENSINYMKSEYNSFFDKIKKNLPLESYYFKNLKNPEKDKDLIDKFELFIEKEREEKIKNIEIY